MSWLEGPQSWDDAQSARKPTQQPTPQPSTLSDKKRRSTPALIPAYRNLATLSQVHYRWTRLAAELGYWGAVRWLVLGSLPESKRINMSQHAHNNTENNGVTAPPCSSCGPGLASALHSHPHSSESGSFTNTHNRSPALPVKDALIYEPSESLSQQSSSRAASTTIKDLPVEILIQIFEYLPSETLVKLLSISHPHIVSSVSASILSSRVHSINSLSGLKDYVNPETNVYKHRIHSSKLSVLTSSEVVGPLFFRSGTVVLFAKHFTRLLPEVRDALGWGYTFVLISFILIFYTIPFFVTYVIYLIMDIYDAIIRTSTFLYLYLHPKDNCKPNRIPANLIRHLKFEATPPPQPQTEPIRCCGPNGTSSPLTCTQPSSLWHLMSPYTPWHLYLLTLHQPPPQSLTLYRVHLVWWFRLARTSIPLLTLQLCQLDETGVSLIAESFSNLKGLVIKSCEVRGGGWDVEGIRRSRVWERSWRVKKYMERGASDMFSSQGTVKSWWITSDTGNESSTAHKPKRPVEVWWFRKQKWMEKEMMTPLFWNLRVVRFELCETVCGIDAVRMILDRCPVVERIEFVGLGSWDMSFLEGIGIIEYECIIDGNGATACRCGHDEDPAEPTDPIWYREGPGWWLPGKEDVNSLIDISVAYTARKERERVIAVQREIDLKNRRDSLLNGPLTSSVSSSSFSSSSSLHLSSFPSASENVTISTSRHQYQQPRESLPETVQSHNPEKINTSDPCFLQEKYVSTSSMIEEEDHNEEEETASISDFGSEDLEHSESSLPLLPLVTSFDIESVSSLSSPVVQVAPGHVKCIVIQGEALIGLRAKWYDHMKIRREMF